MTREEFDDLPWLAKLVCTLYVLACVVVCVFFMVTIVIMSAWFSYKWFFADKVNLREIHAEVRDERGRASGGDHDWTGRELADSISKDGRDSAWSVSIVFDRLSSMD